MPQEEQQLNSEHHIQQQPTQQQQQEQQHQPQHQTQKESFMAPSATVQDNIKSGVNAQNATGKLKGSHSALVKLLESAPIAQIRPILKQKLNDFNGNRDQNHYRKGELGTSKCPWKKSRICAEWLLKNQQETEQQQTTQAVMVSKAAAPSPNETETMPKGEFLPPPAQPAEDVEMTDLEGLACTCHELQQPQDQEDPSVARRNSSDSTDDDELAKCGCGHCSVDGGLSPAMLLSSQHRTSSVSDSGCEDSDCAENKITDLCNRFNENLSKDDVRQ